MTLFPNDIMDNRTNQDLLVMDEPHEASRLSAAGSSKETRVPKPSESSNSAKLQTANAPHVSPDKGDLLDDMDESVHSVHSTPSSSSRQSEGTIVSPRFDSKGFNILKINPYQQTIDNPQPRASPHSPPFDWFEWFEATVPKQSGWYIKATPFKTALGKAMTDQDKKKVNPFNPKKAAEWQALQHDVELMSNSLLATNSTWDSPMEEIKAIYDWIQKSWDRRHNHSSEMTRLFLTVWGLTATIPQHLPGAEFNDDVVDHFGRSELTISDTRLARFWLATLSATGDVTEKNYLFKKTQIFPLVRIESDEHKRLIKDSAETIPLSPKDCYTAVNNILHRANIHYEDPEHDVSKWKEILTDAVMLSTKDRSDLQQELMELSFVMVNTPMELLLDWDGEGVTPNIHAAFWKASVEMWGPHWEDRRPTAISPPSKKVRAGQTPPRVSILKNSLDTQKPSKVVFTDDSTLADMPNGGNFHFREREAPSKIIQAIKKTVQRKQKIPPNKTFLQLMIPVTIDDFSQYGEGAKSAIQAIQNVWRALLAVDPEGNRILDFYDPTSSNSDSGPPLSHRSELPSRRSVFEKHYLEKFKVTFSSSNKPYSTFTFVLGHSHYNVKKILEHTIVQQSLESLQGFMEVDRMQCSSRYYIGNLFGPVPGEQTLRDIEDAIKDRPEYVNSNITDLRLVVERHKLTKNVTQNTPQVSNIHVYVNKEKAAEAHHLLRKTFPSKPKPRASYPEGIQYRFAPEIISGQSIVTKRKRSIIANLITKQLGFNKNNRIWEYEYLKNMHKPHPNFPNITLYKILLAMRSKNNENIYLFNLVEQDFANDVAKFHYDVSLETELAEVLPALPLIIQGHFGEAIAKQWFTDNAWLPVSDYKFEYLDDNDHAQGARVYPTTTDDLAGLDDNWYQDTDGLLEDIADEDEGFIIANLDLAKLDQQSRSILNDDGNSCATNGKSFAATVASRMSMVSTGSDKTGNTEDSTAVVTDGYTSNTPDGHTVITRDNSVTTASALTMGTLTSLDNAMATLRFLGIKEDLIQDMQQQLATNPPSPSPTTDTAHQPSPVQAADNHKDITLQESPQLAETPPRRHHGIVATPTSPPVQAEAMTIGEGK